MFQRDLFQIRNLICCTTLSDRDRLVLAAKGEVTSDYLERALGKPKK